MAESIIEIRGLGKSFYSKNTEVTALRDINLTVEKGDIFGIIGMSGAGKSTLVRCMNYLEEPSQGRVLINGKALSDFSEQELRQIRDAAAR